MLLRFIYRARRSGVGVAGKADKGGPGPGKWSFNPGADQAAILSYTFEIAHCGGTAGADPACEAVSVPLGFRVGEGYDASLGKAGFDGEDSAVDGVEDGRRSRGVQFRVWG
jgi:hypothetical protein